MVTINIEANGDNSKIQITSVTKKARTSPRPMPDKLQTPHQPRSLQPPTLQDSPKPCANNFAADSTGDVRFDDGSRALYSTDGSNYRQVPIGVVLPHDTDDVLATLALCREFGAPVLCRGGGTSLAGQCCNVAVVLDFSKYMARILEIDPDRRIARVQPGVVLDHPPQRRRKTSPHLRTRSRQPRPLHHRRHDRQQLLRRPLRHGRQDRRQHRSPWK